MQNNKEAIMKQNKKENEQIANSYLSIITNYKKEKKKNIQIYSIYPQLNKMDNKQVQSKINNLILDKVYEFLPKIKNSYRKKITIYYYVNYEITHFMNYILSIKFYEFYYNKEINESNYFINSITINVLDGTIYELKDLFEKEVNYKIKINKLLKENLSKVNTTTEIICKLNFSDTVQGFYLTDNSIVIYYQFISNFFCNCKPFLLSIPFHSISHILSKKL